MSHLGHLSWYPHNRITSLSYLSYGHILPMFAFLYNFWPYVGHILGVFWPYMVLAKHSVLIFSSMRTTQGWRAGGRRASRASMGASGLGPCDKPPGSDLFKTQITRVPWPTKKCRVVGVTRMIEPTMDRTIIKHLIIKWDPEVHLGCLVYESYVVFRARSFYDSAEVRF